MPWRSVVLLPFVLIGCAKDRTPPVAVDVAPAGVAVWFVDIAKEAGVDVTQLGGGAQGDYIVDTVGAGAAWLDYDGDLDPDLYLAQGATEAQRVGPPDRLLRNDGDLDGDGIPHFTDVTEQAGLGDREWSFGVATADYDNDGDTDIHLANWGADRLYRNDGDSTFTELGAAAGVADARWSVSAAWSDVDRDGDLDLYVTNYVEFEFERYPARGQAGRRGEPPCRWRDIEVFCGPRNLEASADAFFRNDGDADGDGVPSFVEATREAGLLTAEPYYGLAALFVDTDNDTDDDLYVANDSQANVYFKNRGDGTFEEAGVIAGLAYNEQGYEQASMGIAAADYDGNDLFDLVVTNFSHDHDTLYRNDGMHTFTDVSYPAGIGSASYFTLGWGVAFADLDHDGWEELVVAHGHVYPQVDDHEAGTTFRQRNGIFRNLGDGHFAEMTAEAGPGFESAGSSRALLPVDLEGDGDLDLLFTSLNGIPRLLRNDGKKGHWLAVRLVGERSNRDGIGARVTVSAAGRRQARQITRSSSFAGSTLPVAHFGLGSSARVDRLEVRWPSGARVVREGIDADRELVIREADGG